MIKIILVIIKHVSKATMKHCNIIKKYILIHIFTTKNHSSKNKKNMTQQYSNRKIQRNNTIEFDRRQNYHKLVFDFHLRVITVMYNLPYPRLGNFLKYIPIG